MREKKWLFFSEMGEGRFQGAGRWLGVALFLLGKVVPGLLLSIFGIGSIINVLVNMRVVGKAKIQMMGLFL